MKKILICFFALTVISGCVNRSNHIQPNGYYSNGAKFAYCKNPIIFNNQFIDFINKKYLKERKSKIEYITSIKSKNGDDYSVHVPMQCSGEFFMTDNRVFDFDVSVSITQQGTPNIDAITISENKEASNNNKEEFLNSFGLPSIKYCEDLMKKARIEYGKAPLCVPVIKKGQNLTKFSGLVGLSDEITGKNIYYFMTITPNSIGNEYTYDPRELSSLISFIKYQNKGI